jgi:hypothetical protein
MINIRTNHNWHKFKTRHDVPKRTLAKEFDWVDDETYDGFIRRYKDWFHLSEFERISGYSPELKDWDGIKNFTFSSGLLIKLNDDGERYKIAYYWVTNDR